MSLTRILRAGHIRNHVPVILQGESNECGLACLSMLLHYHGRRIPLPELRGSSGPGRLSLERLAGIAANQRLLARALRCEPEQLGGITLPAILHVDLDHYVVLTQVSRHGVSVIDPASGPAELTWELLDRRFTGIVLECTPGTGFEPSGDRPLPHLRQLLAHLRLAPLLPGLAGLLALTLCVQFMTLVSPYYLQLVVDQVLILSNGDLLYPLTSGFLLLAIIAAFLRYLQGLLAIRMGSFLSYSLAAGLMDKTLRLPLAHFYRRQVGDFLSRFASLRPLQDFVSRGLVSLCLDALMMLATLTMLVIISPRVALCVFFLTAFFLVLQVTLQKPYRRHTREHVINDARLQSSFVETIQGIDTIKRNRLEVRRKGIWLNRLVDSINPLVSAGQWELGIDTCRYLLSATLTLAVVHFSVERITGGETTVGALYTLVAYAGHFVAAATGCSREWQGLALLSLHAQRLSDITEAPADARVQLALNEPVTHLKFHDVSFGYPGSGEPILQGINLDIRAGEKIAITGPSGAGKSSLLGLITGDQQPLRGEIVIDGRPLTAGTDPAGCVSILHQSDSLLAGTVTDNITLFEPSPDESRLVAAARAAGIHDDILRMPLAYREKVSMQQSLSSGQRQRLLIARALYRDAPLLLLDEATSHLDAAMEMAVMQRILNRPGIVLFVTHRQEISVLADGILSLPQGLVTRPGFRSSMREVQ